MKLKQSCADFTFPLLGHDEALSLISMLGLAGADIGLFEGRSHLWPSRVFRDISKSAAALGKKLTDRGLGLADVFVHAGAGFEAVAINNPDAKVRRTQRSVFLKTLEFTHLAGGKHVTACPGVRFAGETRKESLQRCADEMSWRVEEANAAGMVFAVEPHLGSIIPNPEDTLKLLQLVPGLTLTLDYTHFTKVGMLDARIEPLVAHASHFHVRGGCKGRLQSSFKANSIDYARVLQAMKATGYRGYLGLEYCWIDWEHCNETDNLSETILFRDYLKKLS